MATKKINKSAKAAAKTKRTARVRKTRKAVKPTVQKKTPKSHASASGVLQVHDLSGKSVETLNLDPLFSGHEVHAGIVFQAILKYRAGEREGTAATKTRGEVRGGGKKPWKQKGTGQARHGSRRSPIWRGGGATFGPHPRDYSYALPEQIRKKAVAEVVRDKAVNGKLYLVSRLEVNSPKTKEVSNILRVFKLDKPLFVVEKKSDNLLLASRNVRQVSVKTAQEINALDVVAHKECVMTKEAYSGLIERLKS